MHEPSALKGMMPAKIGRASRTLGQLWQVPTFFVGLMAFLLVAATAPWRQENAARQFDDDCEQLRAAYKDKNARLSESIALADGLVDRAALFPAKTGLACFLAGSLYQRSAEELPRNAPATRTRALELLEKANAQGVSETDTPFLLFRLGKLLLENGSDRQRALDYLAASVERGTEQQARAYGMLVEGYLSLPTPNLDAALEYSQKQMQYAEEGPENWHARLLRGRLLVQKGKLPEAVKELEHIPAGAPRELRLEARLLQAESCEQAQLWNRAVPIWKELQKDGDSVPRGKTWILYHVGLCQHRSDPPEDMEAQAAFAAAAQQGGEIGQAAGLRLGEIYFHTGDADKGLAQWANALAKVREAGDYKNQLLPLAVAREMFEHAWQEPYEKHAYDRALQVAELFRKIAAAGMAEQWLGVTLESRARELQKAQGVSAADDKAQPARLVFAQAGAAYESAAAALSSDQQPPLLWHGALCFLEAGDYAHAVTLLQTLVRFSNDDDTMAEAYLKLADAHRALGQKAPAREALYKCIEYPATRFAARARYQLALEAIEARDFEQAESILKQAVTGPAVDRLAHEQSLYQLADLLFQRQNYDQASVFLKEAVRQYPKDSNVFSARDRLAVSYRKLADEAKKKLMETRVTREAQVHYRRTQRELLDKGSETYQMLADDLAKAPAPLPAALEGLYRKAQFAVADLLCEKNEYGEALRRYQILLDKYRGQFEGIYACNRIWQCGRILQSDERQRAYADEATRLAVQKTLLDVSLMPDDHAAFRGTDRPARSAWLQWLNQTNESFKASSRPQSAPGPTTPR